MRLRTAVLLVIISGLPALAQKPAKQAPPDVKKTAAPQRPRGVPADAKQVEPGIWEARRGDGSVARFRETPWGVMPLADAGKGSTEHALPGRTSADAGAFGLHAAADPGVRVYEQGDMLKFEKDTPFGTHRWTRKKSELTDFERQVWDGARKPVADARGSEPSRDRKGASSPGRAKE